MSTLLKNLHHDQFTNRTGSARQTTFLFRRIIGHRASFLPFYFRLCKLRFHRIVRRRREGERRYALRRRCSRRSIAAPLARVQRGERTAQDRRMEEDGEHDQRGGTVNERPELWQ